MGDIHEPKPVSVMHIHAQKMLSGFILSLWVIYDPSLKTSSVPLFVQINIFSLQYKKCKEGKMHSSCVTSRWSATLCNEAVQRIDVS